MEVTPNVMQPVPPYVDPSSVDTGATQAAVDTAAAAANTGVAPEAADLVANVNTGQAFALDTTAPELGAPNPSTSDPTRAATSFSAALDDLLVLLTDLVKTNLVMGQLDQESRELEMNAQVKAINDSADKMVEAAHDQFIGAAVGFAVTCAVSAVSVGMSVKSANLTTEAGEATQAATNTESQLTRGALKAEQVKADILSLKRPPEIEQDLLDDAALKHQKVAAATRAELGRFQLQAATLNASATKWSAGSQALGQVGASAGNMVSASYGIDAANAQADGKRLDGQAAQDDFQKSKLTDRINATHDLVQKVLDTMKTLIELNNATAEKVNQPV
jgi:hypothetical protein